MSSKKNIYVIGSGVSSLTAAITLAAHNQNVTILEKNDQPGGRLRKFSESGFTFDMGPSWYWMPEVFEKFYNKFNYTTSDFYHLVKLDPGFQVIYSNAEAIKIPASWDELLALFEKIEKGGAENLKKFMVEAEYKYRVGIDQLVYKPGLQISELLSADIFKGIFKLQIFTSFRKHVARYFKDERLISLMEFPVLFLGAMPKDTPALYSLMNYSGLKQGTYYPMGGFSKIIDALNLIAKNYGVKLITSAPVTQIQYLDKKLFVKTSSHCFKADGIIAGADYNHIENLLAQEELRNYDEKYWSKRIFAPSCLIFYVGVSKKIDKLEHHNLFFDEDLNTHATEIYSDPKWPNKPLFYVCCPSKTDHGVAPEGKENLFILMPLAPGLQDNEAIREDYFKKLMKRLEKFTGSEITKYIEYKRSYCVSDFVKDYNSYKGNAYGLANTLRQTANLKPKIKNKHIPNFYYSGQLTVPGPGVPPAIISGQVAANELLKNFIKDL